MTQVDKGDRLNHPSVPKLLLFRESLETIIIKHFFSFLFGGHPFAWSEARSPT